MIAIRTSLTSNSMSSSMKPPKIKPDRPRSSNNRSSSGPPPHCQIHWLARACLQNPIFYSSPTPPLRHPFHSSGSSSHPPTWNKPAMRLPPLLPRHQSQKSIWLDRKGPLTRKSRGKGKGRRGRGRVTRIGGSASIARLWIRLRTGLILSRASARYASKRMNR